MNVFPLVLVSLLSATPLEPGNHKRSLEVEGQTRTYEVHVPSKYDPRMPTPVVLIFHGAFMNGSLMVPFTGLNKTSDQHGFIAVYPNGTGKSLFLFFNPSSAATKHMPNDVTFVDRLLDDLAGVVNVDPKRVYATGMSNGGMMCYRLAADLSHRIAAIAPVAGTMTYTACQPSRPVSVLHFHGTDDKLVRFEGPDGPRITTVQSVDACMQLWANIDGCPPRPRTEVMPNATADGMTVTKTNYGPGKEGSEVILYTVQGGGHTWPGQESPIELLGKSTLDISANDLIWDFFQHHPMP